MAESATRKEEGAEQLDRLVVLARQAGDAALAYYKTDVSVSWKHDHSPVTAADLAAHAVICDKLSKLTPDAPVVSEEGAVLSAGELPECWWLVDPLDGTKEFLAGNGEFTVNIAFVERGEPVLGVVHAPALDVTYFAGRGLGAWRRRGLAEAERICSAPVVEGQALVVAESRSHPSAEMEAFLSSLRVAHRIRVGSSLKFCLVAEGTADIYPRLGPTMEWDVAAGDCVFRNSGADIDVPRISPLTYGKPGMRNESFVLGLNSDVTAATK